MSKCATKRNVPRQATIHATLLRDQLARKIQFGINQVFISIKPNLVEGSAPRKGSMVGVANGLKQRLYHQMLKNHQPMYHQMLKIPKYSKSPNAQTHHDIHHTIKNAPDVR
ncbi:hypothetical protein B5C06_08620 [Staphylococcus delphini]|nr:hypothetical protein B5C06_08620 [Staphylococcus delphini]